MSSVTDRVAAMADVPAGSGETAAEAVHVEVVDEDEATEA